MSNITTYNPLKEGAGWDPLADVNDWLRGFFVRPMMLESRAGRLAASFRVDITENDSSYRVLAEMPGVRKEDISVTINGSEVTVAGEVRREQEAGENTRQLWSERWQGKLQRSFRFEHDIDESGAQARHADGVLELVLPKHQAAAGKRITVH
jgi:HSP20 family protein